MIKEKYKDFIVYSDTEKNIFVHIKIDIDSFYDELISFFFKEEKILGYINNKVNVDFNATPEDFVSLYKTLTDFIDDENLEINLADLKKELSNYIDWENYSDKDLLKLRRDKIGKVGEYILHNVLVDYFKFTCVLPKLVLTTNKNMSVFGIDVIFWDYNERMLLFGESKVSKSLDDGIELINKSLNNYEHQICEEFRTILSRKLLPTNLPDDIKEYINKALSFKKFIEISKTTKIGIPIFIMSGNDIDVNQIFKKLDRVKKQKILDLDVKYYIINIPIIDKNVFQTKIISFLRERCDFYESECQ
ncbi:MAG: DUF1837 domain-containing protein [Bacilli bacterium]|nr:DUF1837 domain-containing protein [Bacilli bacterium]